MKKLLVACAMILISAGVFAQAQPKKDAKDAKAKTTKMTVVKKDEAKKETAKVVPITKPATAGKPVKKDGTPDMRFKENKAAKAPVGPTKKDGTPDMRYKTNNKDAGKKKKG